MSTESTLYRIISGKLKYEDGSYIRDPSLSIKRRGREVYDQLIEFLEDDCLDDRQIKIMLMENGLWSSDKEKRLNDLPKLIENNKVFYFQNYNNPTVRKTYKNLIVSFTKELDDLCRVRHKYQYLTPDGIASTAMWLEMISHMYSGPNKIGALGYYHSNSIDEEEIRELALSNEWSSYSSLAKNPLSKSPLKMTDLQKKLMSWTNIYRNVRSHPEFPGQKILEDHDAFDGWMIQLNRKETAEKSHKVHIDNLKPNTRNVYMGKADKNDYEEIMALNTPEAAAKVREAYEVSKH